MTRSENQRKLSSRISLYIPPRVSVYIPPTPSVSYQETAGAPITPDQTGTTTWRRRRILELEETEVTLPSGRLDKLESDFRQLTGYIVPLMQSLTLRVDNLEATLKSKTTLSPEDSALELQNTICEKLSSLLNSEYKDKYVAITYDGRIIASAETDIELLQKLQEMDYPADQIFLHKVGSRAFAGWV